MFYRNLKKIENEQFKRLTGVKREVFEQMAMVVREKRQAVRKHPKRGVKPKLRVEDQLLMLLMYYREYRTQLHIGMTYGLSESRVSELISELESILIEEKCFHLPGKKALLSEPNAYEVVLVDATESPVERPKKNSADITRAKRRGTRKRPKWWSKEKAGALSARPLRAEGGMISGCSRTAG
jgi:hypothetical protein